ncbi:WecB/TagA/CpsF family glycosyltransferase [Spirilliplanes yamanashiensis]|uniref:WecB/TagA/CpsF family glycosyltransferase n=1 Tax=Spirilliplanes yamanashiensis TaxID=42233 RepID=UPI00194EA5AA|nr:WecB/TagA/CpsF family glycosyltransferase [Spirilliplanes yamanashiensis]MDP9816002.1 N-acetylglucosaminyldiphosphoundecaprenol N-acetyl-beta-D-mannosaminyltransferase [Spirilliplanes yamanashiensis]
MTIDAFSRIELDGTGFDRVTEDEVVAIVRRAIERGDGGRIITPNVDILRQARHDEQVRAYLAEADLVVADGMPLVWASKLSGTPLPERVAGSSLIWSLSEGLGRDGRSVFVLGGNLPDPVTGELDGATRAAGRLAAASPGLRIAGCLSPEHGFERDPATFAAVCAKVVKARPDMVYVGLGFPKQEWVVTRLRELLPRSWFIGCGAAVNFVAGDCDRAPAWMQRSGLEWAHRLGTEPGRLAKRYLRHDAPYALRLLAQATARR